MTHWTFDELGDAITALGSRVAQLEALREDEVLKQRIAGLEDASGTFDFSHNADVCTFAEELGAALEELDVDAPKPLYLAVRELVEDNAAIVAQRDALVTQVAELQAELQALKDEYFVPTAPRPKPAYDDQCGVTVYGPGRGQRRVCTLPENHSTHAPPQPVQSEATRLVTEFHKAFGVEPSGDHWTFELRARLIKEEAKELRDELVPSGVARDYDRIAKELADLVVVTYGTAITLGIDLDEALRLVHASNMSKLGDDGKPVKRADGKILKGPGYVEPDMGTAIL
jgi:NTP pyrophosphatase (non-canonical NTP hydrolase)